MSTIAKRLTELGITLPHPPVAVAAYVPYVVTGNLVFISGQIPVHADGTKLTGRVGSDVDLAKGQAAAPAAVRPEYSGTVKSSLRRRSGPRRTLRQTGWFCRFGC